MKMFNLFKINKSEDHYREKVIKYVDNRKYKKAIKYLNKINIEEWNQLSCASFIGEMIFTWFGKDYFETVKTKDLDDFILALLSKINKNHYNELYLESISQQSYVFAQYFNLYVSEIKADEAYWILLKMNNHQPTKELFLNSLLEKMDEKEVERAISYAIVEHFVNLFNELTKIVQDYNIENVLKYSIEIEEEKGKNLSNNPLYLNMYEKYAKEQKAIFYEEIKGEKKERKRKKI